MSPGSGTGFQTFVNNELPPAVAGDFAGANIRSNVVAGAGAYVATPAGVTIGVGGWADPSTGQVSNYYRPNSFPGFVHREGQAIVTTFLGVASALIQSGDMVTLMNQGDFSGIFAAGGTPGQKVYFDAKTGALTAAAAGGSVVGANTGASITAGVLTTTDADQSGSALAVGQIITGVGVPPGTYIASADGTGSGTHLWNLANLDGTTIADVTSETMANTGVTETQFFLASTVKVDASFTATIAAPVIPSPYSVMTVTAVGSGVLAPGQWLSSAGASPFAASLNVQIIEQLTAVAPASGGGTGTYLVTNGAVVGSGETIVGTQGKIGRISSWTTA